MANEYSVTLLGGPPWGFRLGESGCQERPVRVSRLSSGGKAWQQGVQEGDILLTVAGKNVQSLPQAHQMVKEAAGGVLPLTLVREEPSQEEKMYKSFTTIEVNRSPTGDPPTWGSSSSSSSSSTGSCSTTIVVNSSPRRLLPAPPLPTQASQTPNSPSSSRVKDTTGKRKDGCGSCSSSPEPTSRTSAPSPTPSGSPYPPLNVKVSSSSRRVWSPVGQTQQEQQQQQQQGPSSPGNGPRESQNVSGDPSGSSASPSENKENMSPVWQPFGGGPDDKPRFRSVKPASPATQRKDPGLSVSSSKPLVCSDNSTGGSTEKEDQGGGGGGPLSPGGTSRIGVSSGLLQYQNPTITLLQKARDDEVPSDAVLIDQRVTVDGDQIHTDSYYALPRQEVVATGNTRVIKAPAKISGIGPTEKGIPVTLRSGVKEEYASDWYKSMYKSLHKSDKPEDYVSVKYGKKAGRMPHHGGYMSEPEFERDDDQYPSRYGTLDSRRKTPPQATYSTDTTTYNKDGKASFYLPSHICAEVYKNQPRSIAEYEPGRSSIAEREARREDSEDSEQHTSKYLPPMDMPRPSYIDGYESDSTLIRKTGNRLRPLDPVQQKAWYREVQRGGDIPFSGLGKPAPERPKQDPEMAPPLPPPPPPPTPPPPPSLSEEYLLPQHGHGNYFFPPPHWAAYLPPPPSPDPVLPSPPQRVSSRTNSSLVKLSKLKPSDPKNPWKIRLKHTSKWPCFATSKAVNVKTEKTSSKKRTLIQRILGTNKRVKSEVSQVQVLQVMAFDDYGLGASNWSLSKDPGSDETLNCDDYPRPCCNKETQTAMLADEYATTETDTDSSFGGTEMDSSFNDSVRASESVYQTYRARYVSSQYTSPSQNNSFKEQLKDCVIPISELQLSDQVFEKKLKVQTCSSGTEVKMRVHAQARQEVRTIGATESSSKTEQISFKAEDTRHYQKYLNEVVSACTKSEDFEKLKNFFSSTDDLASSDKSSSNLLLSTNKPFQELYALIQRERMLGKSEIDVKKIEKWHWKVNEERALKRRDSSVDETKQYFETLPKDFSRKKASPAERIIHQKRLGRSGSVADLVAFYNGLNTDEKPEPRKRLCSSLPRSFPYRSEVAETKEEPKKNTARSEHVSRWTTNQERLSKTKATGTDHTPSKDLYQALHVKVGEEETICNKSRPIEFTEFPQSPRTCYSLAFSTVSEPACGGKHLDQGFPDKMFLVLQTEDSSAGSQMSVQSDAKKSTTSDSGSSNVSVKTDIFVGDHVQDKVEYFEGCAREKVAPPVPPKRSSRNLLPVIKVKAKEQMLVLPYAGSSNEAPSQHVRTNEETCSTLTIQNTTPKIKVDKNSGMPCKKSGSDQDIYASCSSTNLLKTNAGKYFHPDYVPEKTVSTVDLLNSCDIADTFTRTNGKSTTVANIPDHVEPAMTSESASQTDTGAIKTGHVKAKRRTFEGSVQKPVKQYGTPLIHIKVHKDGIRKTEYGTEWKAPDGNSDSVRSGSVGKLKQQFESMDSLQITGRARERHSIAVCCDTSEKDSLENIPGQIVRERARLLKLSNTFSKVNEPKTLKLKKVKQGLSAPEGGLLKKTQTDKVPPLIIELHTAEGNPISTINKRLESSEPKNAATQDILISAREQSTDNKSKVDRFEHSECRDNLGSSDTEPVIHKTEETTCPTPPTASPSGLAPRMLSSITPNVVEVATVGPPPPPLPNYSEDELLSNLARDQVSPHRYQEGEVNIHYRTPIRNLEKEFIEEETLRKRQEARMRKFYEEERYKKQLQQMHEIEMRRHNDFFTPSQKSPIPLNRYDNPFEQPESPPPKTPEPKLIARALFNFQAQTSRELSLKKGDIVYVTKKIDRNWYEGEHHGLLGIFPVNYVEIIPMETAGLQPRKSTEGQAKAKFNFRSQTPVELSLFKGELVILTRRVDQNWFEGRIGNKKGIFPASYVDVLTEPTDSGLVHCKRSPKLNGHHRVNTPYRSREAFSSYPATSLSTSRSDTTSMSSQDDKKQPVTETLHVDTYSEPIPYKVLYGYRPQNDDELELREGDTVYVMEKCDDGWYVGTSLRTGLFGTFPGNYVERI